MAVLRVVRTRIQLQLMCQNQTTAKNFYNFWLISQLKDYDISEYKIEDKNAVVHGIEFCGLTYTEDMFS
jgi:hypothetical protein